MAYYMQLIGVLTGDFIDSQALSPEDHVLLTQYFKSLPEQFNSLYPEARVSAVEVFRGDSWQLVVHELSHLISLASFLRIGLKAHLSQVSLDTRIGIGVGRVTLLADRVSESLGSAFIASGKALAQIEPDLERSPNLSLLCGDDCEPAVQTLLSTLALTYLPMLGDHINRLSLSESQAIFGTLAGMSQSKIAKYYSTYDAPVTQQAVYNALKRARWGDLIAPTLQGCAACLVKF